MVTPFQKIGDTKVSPVSPPYTTVTKEIKNGLELMHISKRKKKRSGHRTPVGFLPLGKRGAGVSPAMHDTAEWSGCIFPIEENLLRVALHPLLIFNRREKMDFAHNCRFLPLDYKIPADDINASENGKFCPVLMI